MPTWGRENRAWYLLWDTQLGVCDAFGRKTRKYRLRGCPCLRAAGQHAHERQRSRGGGHVRAGECRRRARVAGVRGRLRGRLPARAARGGVDAQLGEGGSGLSVGQMQRLAVARAVYSDAPVLLLDECTSALDQDIEHRMLSRLRDLDKTVIIVTHRPTALEVCDRVIQLGE